MGNAKLCLAFLFFLLTGCVSGPPPKPLESAFYKNTSQTVGVYIAYPERADTYLPGADCLLCLAVAASANGELTSHITKLSADEFAELPKLLKAKLQEYNIAVVHINENNLLERLRDHDGSKKYSADKNYRPLKNKYGINTLIVVDIQEMGVERTYSAYVPTSPPRGYIAGRTYVVDLDTNIYTLYQPIMERVAVEGKWDEPPRFPGATNAFYKAVAIVKNTVVSFFERDNTKTKPQTHVQAQPKPQTSTQAK